MLEEDGEEHVHPVISTIFMEAATEAIHSMSDVSCMSSFIFPGNNIHFPLDFRWEIFLISVAQRELVDSMGIYF